MQSQHMLWPTKRDVEDIKGKLELRLKTQDGMISTCSPGSRRRAVISICLIIGS